ncbi:MAG: dihydroorotase [Bdellovibrionales bacterium]|nr:dihydroorotase [Bdellovibrionales bacterium]
MKEFGDLMANENEFDLIIQNADLVLSNPDNPSNFKIEKMDLGIKNGQISSLGTLSNLPTKEKFQGKGLTILPGLIDTQVHFREPGLEHKETIEMGSRSAVAGGITGFFEMPNTNPATLTKQDLERKIHIAENTSYCDFAFYMGAAQKNVQNLAALEKLPGCCGVKVFMGSSTGSLLVDNDDLLRQVLENTHRRIAVHCEDEPRLKERKYIAQNSNGDVSKHEEWRDEETALLATQRLVRLAKPMNHPIHILHISTQQEMEFLKTEKTGDLITVEVLPQHLSLESPDCYVNLGTKAQMNPPIRNTKHRQALWKALQAKVVDVIGSDHAPHTLEEKSKTYPETPSGMPGVQTTLPVLLNHMHRGHIGLTDIVRLMAVNPSRIFGIRGRGFIAPKYEASLTIVDLNKEMTIENQWIESKSHWTPFHGQKVKGWPIATLVRGQFAMRDGVLSKVPTQAFEFQK